MQTSNRVHECVLCIRLFEIGERRANEKANRTCYCKKKHDEYVKSLSSEQLAYSFPLLDITIHSQWVSHPPVHIICKQNERCCTQSINSRSECLSVAVSKRLCMKRAFWFSAGRTTIFHQQHSNRPNSTTFTQCIRFCCIC